MQYQSFSPIRSVCVYCGSSSGHNPVFIEEAKVLGQALASHNIRLIYGGGDSGLMGAVAYSALQAGGTVMGIIPHFLRHAEQPSGAKGFEKCTMVGVPDMHTRKKKMFDEADAFIALPGGIGTLEEIVEIQTWAQLSRHNKPMALLNTQGFWTCYIKLLDQMQDTGFLHHADKARPQVFEKASDIIPFFTSLPQQT